MQTRLQGALKAYDAIEKNSILESEVNELKVLEMLEKEVYTVLLEKTIKPTKWSDVIETVEMVTKQKRLLLGRPTERSVNTIDITGMDEKDLDGRIAALKLLTESQPAEITKEESTETASPSEVIPVEEPVK